MRFFSPCTTVPLYLSAAKPMIFRLQETMEKRSLPLLLMEVLLLIDIPGIGKKNDLLVVRRGFALNHLLPHRKALVVTPNVRKRYAEQIKQRALEKESEKQLQSSLFTALGGKVIHLTAKANKVGKLYAAISESAVADAIKREHNMDVSVTTITVPEPIKKTGSHVVQLTVGVQSIPLTVEVRAEKES